MGGKGVRKEHFDLDLWEKVGNLDFWDGGGVGGVFWNFKFGVRKKSWKFGFLGWGGGYSGTSDLDLGKKLEIWIFGMGGYSGTSNLDLGKKVGNLDFWDGGGILELWIWT